MSLSQQLSVMAVKSFGQLDVVDSVLAVVDIFQLFPDSFSIFYDIIQFASDNVFIF